MVATRTGAKAQSTPAKTPTRTPRAKRGRAAASEEVEEPKPIEHEVEAETTEEPKTRRRSTRQKNEPVAEQKKRGTSRARASVVEPEPRPEPEPEIAVRSEPQQPTDVPSVKLVRVAKRRRGIRSSTAEAMPASIAFAGVVIDDVPVQDFKNLAELEATAEPEVVAPQILGAPVQGKPASGRKEKEIKKQRTSASIYLPSNMKKTWDQKVEERMQAAAWKAELAERKAEIKAERDAARERRVEKKKRKEENERRSQVVQKITNSNTLRKMSKKQLRLLRREA